MAKQEDMLEGSDQPGVGKVRNKKLDALADKFTECRDQKAELAKEMTSIEGKIIELMTELKIPVYRYADREVRIKFGKNHVSVKTVKVGDEE